MAERTEIEVTPERLGMIEGVTREVFGERIRQISEENHTLAHDDSHEAGQLAWVAVAYALQTDRVFYINSHLWPVPVFPQDWAYRHKADRRRSLLIATALLCAEIERVDRAEAYEERRAMAEESRQTVQDQAPEGQRS
jgi:hypothetical protein